MNDALKLYTVNVNFDVVVGVGNGSLLVNKTHLFFLYGLVSSQYSVRFGQIRSDSVICMTR